jgi:DNA polymerase III subunit gamma/tau
MTERPRLSSSRPPEKKKKKKKSKAKELKPRSFRYPLPLVDRYRPRSFGEVVGQDKAVTLLRRMVKKNAVMSVLLFAGPPGVGKTSLARILAACLHCLHGAPIITPCGVCKECAPIFMGARGVTMRVDDYLGIDLDSASRMRDFITLSRYTWGGPKINIVERVEDIPQRLLPKLFRVLEEPPIHSRFFLTTNRLSEIQSEPFIDRCTVIELKPIRPRIMTEYIKSVAAKERVKLEASVLRNIVNEADDSMRRAMHHLDTELIGRK